MTPSNKTPLPSAPAGMVCIQQFFDKDYASNVYTESIRQLTTVADIVPVMEPINSDEGLSRAIEQLRQSNVSCIIVQSGTFAPGYYLQRLAVEFQVPFLLWALPEPEYNGDMRMNSLCSVNLHASILHPMGRTYDYVYGSETDSALYEKLGSLIRICQAIDSLKAAKLGIVGTRMPGFHGSGFDELRLEKTFGISSRPIGSWMLQQKLATHKEAGAFREAFGDFEVALADEQYDTLCSLGEVFLEIAQEEGILAYAVNCWHECTRSLGVVTCGVHAYLVDRGIMAGCEGDVLATVTMMIEHALTGLPPFMADMVHAEQEANRVVFWHCGNAPLSLCAPGNAMAIQENGRMDFPCKGGKVTLAKLSETAGHYRMLIARGEAKEDLGAFKGTSVVVDLEDAGRFMDTVIYEGFEHHFVLVYEDIYDKLKTFCRFLNIEIVEA